MLKLLLDADGHVVVRDGKPVWVDDNNKEFVYDANESNTTIRNLNNEARSLRTRAEKAENDLKAFEGIDPAAARTALDTVANLDDKKLVDAGQVETIKAETAKAIHKQYEPVVAERDKYKAELQETTITNLFAGSKWVEDNVVIPPDMVQFRFSKQIKFEDDGSISFLDASGNALYSQKNAGAVLKGKEAFEEAIQLIVDGYPRKADILKGVNADGSGTRPGTEGVGGKNPWKTGDLTEQDKIEAKDPALAGRLKAQAGVAA